jgi:RNA polymerase sigma-70 factor (ECF subfamily)
MTESQLVERCRQGDRNAQRELYARTCDRIYRLLLRMTRNPDDASDLAQSVYVRVFQNIHQFKQSSGLTTWVYRIAMNQALQWLRSEKRRGLRHLKAQSEHPAGSEPNAADARLDVEIALARLTDEERALVTLRYFDELNYAEISEILGRPSGTIGSELNRIRHKLRNLLLAESSAAS